MFVEVVDEELEVGEVFELELVDDRLDVLDVFFGIYIKITMILHVTIREFVYVMPTLLDFSIILLILTPIHPTSDAQNNTKKAINKGRQFCKNSPNWHQLSSKSRPLLEFLFLIFG